MSLTWHGVPVTFREGFVAWADRERIAVTDVTDVLVDEIVVGRLWLAGDGWDWVLSGSTTTGVRFVTRRRAIDALLVAYGTALDAWATP